MKQKVTRFALTLLVMMLTMTQAAWATTTSTINVGGTDYALFTGFTATSGNGMNYAKLVDSNTSTDWQANKNSGDPNAPAGHFNGGTEDPAFVEFHADEAFIPKGYVLTCYHENAGFWKPVEWALKAKLNEGDEWTTIHSSNTTLGAGKTFQIPCSNGGDNEYQYFRFEVYEVGATDIVDLDELQFYGLLPAYTHLTVKAATCTATGIKVDCYLRNSDGKYFTDETGATELAESDVIAPIIPHTGEHHEATDVNIEYWQCSMCGKYFSNEGCTTEITEEDTKIYRTITIDNSISGLVTVAFSKTQALAGESIILYVDYQVDASTLKVNNGAVELTAVTDIQYTFTMPVADVTVTAEVAQSNADGDILTGSIRHRVTITDGASITLNNATITGGIVCNGTATITLVGTNSVSGATNKAGIQIGGSGTTLTIRGNGSLTANGGNQSAGIGLSRAWNDNATGGDIVIEGGNITANGSVNGQWGAGIGTGVIKGGTATLGTITIKGGSVKATGGSEADGIGTGYTYYGCTNTIGTVTIYDGIDMVDASSIKDFASVVYMHGETNVTASKTDYFAIGEDGNRRLIVQKPVIADIPDQTYTGSAITPEPTVIAGSLSLTKGTDYTYSYENNTDAGTAKVIATFQGDYASLGYVEKEFTILPSTVVVNVTGNGTVTYNDKVATNGKVIGVVADKGTDVTLTLAPESGYAVSIEYGYTNSKNTTISGIKLPINGTTATLTVPDNLKDGTYVTMTVSFVSALAGGADEASAVALTDNTVTNLAGGWYKVENDITFDHTLNLLADTYLTIGKGKTMTVNTASNLGIDSDYTLTVSGAGALNVTTNDNDGIAVRVGNYVQTDATVTASGYIGIRCADDFLGFDFDNDFTFSGGQLTATGSDGHGIWADNDITLSCSNATDFIQASSYRSIFGAVKIAEGNALTDGTEASNGMNGYSGTLTDEQITAIGGKTLRRAVITSYVDASGTLHENVIAIPLINTMTTLPAGTYVVNSDVAYTSGITTTGDVTLILGDDCTMSFGKLGEPLNATIMECNSHNLNIYGQSGGTGWLKAYSAQDDGIDNVYYTQYSGNVLIFGGNNACIDASEFTILGGTLDVESGGGADGDISGGSISILGGKLWARNKGLQSPQGITLGYTNTTDQIYVTIYNAGGTGLQIADGKTLVDENGVIWSGALYNYQIGDINDRTLKPVMGVTLTKEDYNVSATFNGSSETTVSIPVDVNVTSVTYERTFTEGKPSTVMLPFNKAVSEIGGGTFYTFGGVEKKNNKWEATMNEVTGSLTANTPYLFVPAGTSLTFTGGATLNTTGGGNCLASDAVGWEFHGTYEKKVWNEVETHDYGFAATSGTSADDKSVEAGQFVRLTTGASAKPMRCYLSYVGGPNQARALTRGAAATDEELPSSIIVRLVGANGETTAIGTIDTKTGEMTFDSEAWYTLDGVRLSGKPTKKGLYINNGRKVVIK